VSNFKSKIVAMATVAGLGGLAGYALDSNATRATQADVRTQIIHRTIHVRKHRRSKARAGGRPSGGAILAAGGGGSAMHVVSRSSGIASAPHRPVRTGSSGSGGGGGGEHEREHEHEGGDD
jgi:hypothetical protein